VHGPRDKDPVILQSVLARFAKIRYSAEKHGQIRAVAAYGRFPDSSSDRGRFCDHGLWQQ
jgi:hypothetical protein